MGRREVWIWDGQLFGGSAVPAENRYGAVHHRTNVQIYAGLTDLFLPVLQTDMRVVEMDRSPASGRLAAHRLIAEPESVPCRNVASSALWLLLDAGGERWEGNQIRNGLRSQVYLPAGEATLPRKAVRGNQGLTAFDLCSLEIKYTSANMTLSII